LGSDCSDSAGVEYESVSQSLGFGESECVRQPERQRQPQPLAIGQRQPVGVRFAQRLIERQRFALKFGVAFGLALSLGLTERQRQPERQPVGQPEPVEFRQRLGQPLEQRQPESQRRLTVGQRQPFGLGVGVPVALVQRQPEPERKSVAQQQHVAQRQPEQQPECQRLGFGLAKCQPQPLEQHQRQPEPFAGCGFGGDGDRAGHCADRDRAADHPLREGRVSTTIYAGNVLVMDPSDKRLVTFDWDSEALPAAATISTSVWTITAIRQSGVTALTNDNESIGASSRTTITRLLATTATVGDLYWVSNKVTLSGSPAQEVEQRFKVLIQDQ
jgi:hypothetical protein